MAIDSGTISYTNETRIYCNLRDSSDTASKTRSLVIPGVPGRSEGSAGEWIAAFEKFATKYTTAPHNQFIQYSTFRDDTGSSEEAAYGDIMTTKTFGIEDYRLTKTRYEFTPDTQSQP